MDVRVYPLSCSFDFRSYTIVVGGRGGGKSKRGETQREETERHRETGSVCAHGRAGS